MNHRTALRNFRCYAWRSFDRRQGRAIVHQLRFGDAPCCPFCGEMLEARLASRFRRHLVLDASAFDLDCRACRRFWCVVRHTPRSLRLLRMRKLIAAVRAAGRAEADRSVEPGLAGRPALA